MSPLDYEAAQVRFAEHVLNILAADDGQDGLNRIEDIASAAIVEGLANHHDGEQYSPFITVKDPNE